MFYMRLHYLYSQIVSYGLLLQRYFNNWLVWQRINVKNNSYLKQCHAVRCYNRGKTCVRCAFSISMSLSIWLLHYKQYSFQNSNSKFENAAQCCRAYVASTYACMCLHKITKHKIVIISSVR